MKAECLDKGANPRFVLTNLELPPQELYDRFYVQRGADSEHRIKELKLGIQADRLSCSNFIANQFRLLLSQAAYILMLTIRCCRSRNFIGNCSGRATALHVDQRGSQGQRFSAASGRGVSRLLPLCR